MNELRRLWWVRRRFGVRAAVREAAGRLAHAEPVLRVDWDEFGARYRARCPRCRTTLITRDPTHLINFVDVGHLSERCPYVR